jgi:hypothetical protein
MNKTSFLIDIDGTNPRGDSTIPMTEHGERNDSIKTADTGGGTFNRFFSLVNLASFSWPVDFSKASKHEI